MFKIWIYAIKGTDNQRTTKITNQAQNHVQNLDIRKMLDNSSYAEHILY